MIIQKSSKYKIIAGGLIVLIIMSVLFVFYGIAKKEKVIINKNEISVEIADTLQKQRHGLAGKNNLCDACGMLFVFDDIDTHKFWMKGMQFDIYIVWIKNGKVVDLSKNVSHKTQDKIIISNKKVDNVLEMRAGKIDDFAINVGDYVECTK